MDDLGNIETATDSWTKETHCCTPKLPVRQCGILVACSRPYSDLGLAIRTGDEDAVAKSLMHALLHKWNLSKLLKLYVCCCVQVTEPAGAAAEKDLWQHTSLCI